MMYHELASILNRCEAYAGTFQAPVPFPVPQDVKEAAARLEKRYRLKLPHKTFRSYIQFVLLLAEVMLHRKRMKTELEKGLKANGFTTGRRYDPFFIFATALPGRLFLYSVSAPGAWLRIAYGFAYKNSFAGMQFPAITKIKKQRSFIKRT